MSQADSRAEATKIAWQIFGSLHESTRTVDAKASFALAMESAALAGIAALFGGGRSLDQVNGFAGVVLWLGVAALGLSAVLAVLVVVPRHNGQGRSPRPGEDEFIFYGHLRHWSPAALEQRLTEADPLPTLSRQLVVLSAIAWTKHKRVQQSLALAVVGSLLVAAVVVFA
ncbi:Pycsar system effector family protein [Streptomyces sp. NRRL WC-3549]|uniref:Pycsar system effector family protein n=1 Tax=Streptomyces sp. NRRL WC-3549 TaxID=1463925 RepID=UPI00068B79DF|nr:Pycsar system effector family protein [Streptomyces sp. NRRL WC-3549]